MNKYKVIGLMSGTSMDGVDLACCEFEFLNNVWHFEIKQTQTIPYDNKWLVRLSQLHNQPIYIYPKTDAFYGRYLGKITKQFIAENQLAVDFISSHGHTIFHQPENGFTAQIGCGAAINAVCNLPVVNNFRIIDVILGGQGAPLVPIGDLLLFSQYNACLNLGGFANISLNKLQQAFDISPCNIVFNSIANELDLPYDEEGKLAASGTINNELLQALNAIYFYQKQGAKSLGIEWLNNEFWTVAAPFSSISQADKMATFSEHIATQISTILNNNNLENVLITGGGAYNHFLINKIKSKTKTAIIIPDAKIIEYKEAMVFAFLGVLRIRNETNILKSVTGAVSNSIGGALYGNFSKICFSTPLEMTSNL